MEGLSDMVRTARPAPIIVAAAVALAACSGAAANRAAPSVVPAASTAQPTTTIATGDSASTTLAGSGTTPRPIDLAAVKISTTKIADLEQPTAMALRSGQPTAIYFDERPGRVRVVRDGALVTQPVLDITSQTTTDSEHGLLGLAFSPDGTKLYVHHSDAEGNTELDEYTMSPTGDLADPASRRVLLQQAQPFGNHKGGQLAVGPDAMLYLGLGDGGSANDPQRNGLKLSTLLGKIVRIDPTPSGSLPYTIPPDNPFVGVSGTRPEIWSYGLRNPWRFSFDAANGDLWIGDVGQDKIEEIDRATTNDGRGRGVNFGWSAFEGRARFNAGEPAAGAVGPLFQYEHGDGPLQGCSVIGGYVYRGSAIASLGGAYVFTDYCSSGLRAIDPANPSISVAIATQPSQGISFGEGPANELYVLTQDGPVYRIDPA